MGDSPPSVHCVYDATTAGVRGGGAPLIRSALSPHNVYLPVEVAGGGVDARITLHQCHSWANSRISLISVTVNEERQCQTRTGSLGSLIA